MTKPCLNTRNVVASLLLLSSVADGQITTNRKRLSHPKLKPTNVTIEEHHEQGDRRLFKRYQGITGGSDANGEDYPFFALVFGSETNDLFYYCGGSLITPTVVLTAAHCIDPDDLPVRVRIGGSTNTEGESILVDDVLVHPRYEPNNFLASDFALLYLAEASTATPVTLNQDTDFPVTGGTPLKTIGYGATEDGTQSTNLKQVDLVYVEFDTCQSVYYSGIQDMLHECVDGADPSEGPCVGDSGGPLLYEENIAIGVLSFGAPCGTDGVDVYAKIADNYVWIAQNAGLITPAPTGGDTTPAPTLIGGEPTTEPTDAPPAPPTGAPSLIAEPTDEPTEEPTQEPETEEPTEEPTAEPTAEPTEEPTRRPTTERPTFIPLPQQASLCSFQLLWGGDVFECLGP